MRCPNIHMVPSKSVSQNLQHLTVSINFVPRFLHRTVVLTKLSEHHLLRKATQVSRQRKRHAVFASVAFLHRQSRVVIHIPHLREPWVGEYRSLAALEHCYRRNAGSKHVVCDIVGCVCGSDDDGGLALPVLRILV